MESILGRIICILGLTIFLGMVFLPFFEDWLDDNDRNFKN
jgi:hypothetical protein